MPSIYNLSYQDIEDYFVQHGDKKFRAQQVFDWLYRKRVKSYDEFSNMKKEQLTSLKDDYFIDQLHILLVERDKDVCKFLFELYDGEKIEAVLMNHDYGNSLCISTQVGCNMGCAFCESGRRKKVRNLLASELVLQLLAIEEAEGVRISHVVIMGIGEPFDNYEHLVKFIEIVNHPKGIALGSRHITVSTCGIVPKIYAFAELPFQVNLAISLHAPNDSLRKKIMPISKVYPIHDLMTAIKDYIQKTNRRVTFEYILLDGINDREQDAIELASLLRGINCYVNLIPYNETNHLTFHRSKNEQILKFYDILKKNKVSVTKRKEFGSKISAACGQLRSSKEEA